MPVLEKAGQELLALLGKGAFGALQARIAQFLEKRTQLYAKAALVGKNQKENEALEVELAPAAKVAFMNTIKSGVFLALIGKAGKCL